MSKAIIPSLVNPTVYEQKTGESPVSVPLVGQLPNSRLVDALCYFDPKDDDLADKVREEIEKEMSTLLEELRIRAQAADGVDQSHISILVNHYLGHTSLLQDPQKLTQFEQSGQMPEVSTSEDIVSVSPNDPIDDIKANIRKYKIQLEYMEGAILNLDMFEAKAKETWIRTMTEFEGLVKTATNVVESQTQRIDTINKCRKTSQIETGNQLRHLQKDIATEWQKRLDLIKGLSELVDRCENLSYRGADMGCIMPGY